VAVAVAVAAPLSRRPRVARRFSSYPRRSVQGMLRALKNRR
jgi:hypothetical protein